MAFKPTSLFPQPRLPSQQAMCTLCAHIAMHPPLNFSPRSHSTLSCTGPVIGKTTFWSNCLHGAPQAHLCTHTAMHALTWHSFSTLPLVHPQPLLSKHTGEREHGRMEGGSVYVYVCVCGGGGDVWERVDLLDSSSCHAPLFMCYVRLFNTLYIRVQHIHLLLRQHPPLPIGMLSTSLSTATHFPLLVHLTSSPAPSVP